MSQRFESGKIKSSFIKNMMKGDTRAPMFVASIAQDKTLSEEQRQAQVESLRKMGYIYEGKPFESTVDEKPLYLEMMNQYLGKGAFDNNTQGSFNKGAYK